VQRLLTTAGINQTLRQSLGLLPKSSVQPGDTWEDAFELDAPSGKLRVTSTYTYRGPARLEDHAVEQIDVATVVAPVADKPASAPAAKLSQDYSGTLYFDAAAGRLVRSELEQTRTPAPQGSKPVQVQAVNTVVLRVR
jgi:hypothetical protein